MKEFRITIHHTYQIYQLNPILYLILGEPQPTFRSGRHASVSEISEFTCEKCNKSFDTEEGLRLHSVGAQDSPCIENYSSPSTISRPRKGPTGIGKKSGGKSKSSRKDNEDESIMNNLTSSVVTFENDDACMSRPVSPSKNKNSMAIADCIMTEPLNCAIDVNNLKVEAISMSSSDAFKTTASSGGIYDYSNSLSSNGSLPVAVKSEAIYDSNSQPALGAASSGGDTWKCNQCKVPFESGPQLLEHLDEIRRADHKVRKKKYISTYP